MPRKSIFTCFSKIAEHARSHPHFAIYPAVYATLLFFIALFVSSAFAEETKVLTDADLGKYNAKPMVDPETLSRSEEEMNAYLIRRRSADLLAEKEEMKKRQADEARKLATQQKKQPVNQEPIFVQRRVAGNRESFSIQKSTTASQGPVSVQRTRGRT